MSIMWFGLGPPLRFSLGSPSLVGKARFFSSEGKRPQTTAVPLSAFRWCRQGGRAARRGGRPRAGRQQEKAAVGACRRRQAISGLWLGRRRLSWTRRPRRTTQGGRQPCQPAWRERRIPPSRDSRVVVQYEGRRILEGVGRVRGFVRRHPASGSRQFLRASRHLANKNSS